MQPFASCKHTYTHVHTRVHTRIWRPNSRRFTTAPGGTGKVLPLSNNWLPRLGSLKTKQALWQIYLPGPRYIPRPKFDVSLPNAVHQADLFFLPHDKLPRGRKVYKYALTVVDVASRYKAAKPLTSKESEEVSWGFARIYRRGPLKWPQLLQVDPGREFMGTVTKTMENNKTAIRRGRADIHRDQAIVERFNRTTTGQSVHQECRRNYCNKNLSSTCTAPKKSNV